MNVALLLRRSLLLHRKLSPAKYLVIVAGVSCSGKSYFIDRLSTNPNAQYICPCRHTSKSEIEAYGFLGFIKRHHGTTFLHVEINPDPVSQKRKKWIDYVKKSLDVELIILAPPKNRLIRNVMSRYSGASDLKYAQAKIMLYENEWLSEQYVRFVSRTLSKIPLSSISVVNCSETRDFLDSSDAARFLKAIYE